MVIRVLGQELLKTAGRRGEVLPPVVELWQVPVDRPQELRIPSLDRSDVQFRPGRPDRLWSPVRGWESPAPGKPMDNPFIENFNGRLRNEHLHVELFLSARDARTKLQAWQRD